MKKLNSKILVLGALLLSMNALAYAQEDKATTVIVIRHAEKVKDGDNPGLSDEGVKRAAELIRVVEDAGVSIIYTTQLKRTLDTARPLASRLGVPVVPVEITKENASAYPAALAKTVLSKHAGSVVLIIGHSNTVPLIVEALGGKRPPPIDDATEFDRLFVVTVPKSGEVKVIKAKYGVVK